MTYCTRCDRPLRDGEKCDCGLPERILLPPEMRAHDKRSLTIAISSFIAVMAAIVFLVPPMMGFNKESRQAIAEKAAVEISETAQEAVTELMKEGYGTGPDYLLSYSEDWSYQAPYDNEVFEEKLDIENEYILSVFNDKELVIVESLALENNKTKTFNNMLKDLKLDGKVLVVVDEYNENLFLAARNNE